jgi:hypothetical protein
MLDKEHIYNKHSFENKDHREGSGPVYSKLIHFSGKKN